MNEVIPGPDRRIADEMVAPSSDIALESGVERNQMLAHLQARMFGEQEMVRVGRFELGRRLGAGAMGVVYEARDPQLDRNVALKVLRAGSLDPSRVERLVLEARSLAKLRHPNVVTVYEVGRQGEDRFIVMDLVQGETLGAWLRTPRTWQEVVRIFIAAGEGLRAAHEAGLVHRDFKPDNVLVEDGQPKVVDFGLAAAVDDPTETTLRDTSGIASGLDRFTRTAAFVGTPAYMAPEQFHGRASPAADQYAFCVSLFEALAGRRPHAEAESSGIEALVVARSLELPAGAPQRAPRWLRRVLARGLHPDPQERWSSMSALLGALRRVDGPGRRRVIGGASVLGAVALAAGLGSQWNEGDADRCASAAEPMRAAWSDARRSALARAFTRTELPIADDTWRRVVPVLDAYAQGWSRARRRACTADLAAPEPRPALNVARVRCLERRRADFESLLETLTSPDADIVSRALDAAATIPDLDQCHDAVLLREQMERKPGSGPASHQLYARVSSADAAYRTGADAEAIGEATSVLREAQEAGDHELVALSGMVLSKAHQRRGAVPTSLEAAETAVEASESLGDTRVRVRTRLRLLSVLIERRDFEPARRLARFADAAVSRLEDAAELRARLGDLEVKRLLFEGDPAEALALLDRLEPTLETLDRLRGPLLDRRAEVLEALGRNEDAIATQRRALTLLAERLGEGAPRVIQARKRIASLLANAGRAEEGLAEARRAVREADAALGSDSLISARARATVGIALANSGQVLESEPFFRDAAMVVEARLGLEHTDTAAAWFNLARVLAPNGKADEAVRVLEHAATILRHTLDEDHPEFIYVNTNLAGALVQLERWGEALDAARAAETIAAEHLSTDSTRTVEIRTLVGTAQRGVGDLAGSAATLQAVIAGLEASDGRPALLGIARSELALTHAELGDLGAATKLQHRALRAFEADAGMHDGRIEVIEAWLRDHG